MRMKNELKNLLYCHHLLAYQDGQNITNIFQIFFFAIQEKCLFPVYQQDLEN